MQAQLQRRLAEAARLLRKDRQVGKTRNLFLAILAIFAGEISYFRA
jgi:hypothetical protein